MSERGLTGFLVFDGLNGAASGGGW